MKSKREIQSEFLFSFSICIFPIIQALMQAVFHLNPHNIPADW
jgi:hypothetical protein